MGANESATCRLLGVSRLVELNHDVTGHLETGHQAVALVGDFVTELDATAGQRRYGLLNVVAIERDIMCSGPLSI